MDFVCTDLGASSTRYVSNDGEIAILPNNMVFVNNGALVDQRPYSDDIEDALDVTIESSNGCEYFPARVLIGSMGERYPRVNEKPNSMTNKCKQRINYVSEVIAVAISKYRCGLGEDIDVYLALPPGEVEVAKVVMSKNLIGSYTVTFNKLDNMKVEFNIKNVHIYEESFMAILAYFFDMNCSLRDEAKKYNRGAILSVDVGASTTDIAVVKDMRYIDKSGQTYKIGGNIAADMLKDKIREMYGFEPDDNQIEDAVMEGRLQMGDTYVDCKDALTEAKEVIAERIVQEMNKYFIKVGIPIQSVRAIVVSGGGSMRSQYVSGNEEVVYTSSPVSDFITKALNKICNGVAVEQFTENPRLANIMGLYIRAMADIRKKSR